MTTTIHPTAIIDPATELGEGVTVGPNAIIEAGVMIGDRTQVGAMVHIQGTTTIGPDCRIYTGATIGFPPQYLGFDGSPTRCTIGARCTIREYATVHRGLKLEERGTVIGDECFLMATAHVAHDCLLGNRVIVVNGALLAGHVEVGDGAFLSGNAVFHQFVRVGTLAMISGLAWVNKDVPPYSMVHGHPGRVRGVNSVGMRRAGFPAHVRSEIRRVLRAIHQPGQSVTERVAALNPYDHSAQVQHLIEFYRTSKRGVLPFQAATDRDSSSDDE